MSKYTREQQIEIVKWAMNLQATIESEQAQISMLQNSKFRAKPLPPSHQKAQPIQPNYPTAQKSNYSFSNHIQNDKSFIGKLFSKKGIIAIVVAIVVGNILGIVLQGVGAKIHFFGVIGMLIMTICGFIIPACVIVFIIKYVEYLGKRKEYNNQLANSPEYLNARAEAERVAKQQEADNQKKLDEQYETAMATYNSTLENYNSELAEYESKKKIELSILNQDLSLNINALTELYDTTLLIPKNNRALNELIWMYEDMSTSEHDFERALDMLNANKQIANTEDIKSQMSNLTNVMYQGLTEVLNSIDYSNYQLDEINNNLGKVRRDINLGNIAAASQRHGVNKNIKNTNSKLDNLLK